VKYGNDVHVQWSTKFWSPHKSVRLGDHVGIGNWCDISTDLVIGNHVLVAGAVAFLARDAHSAYVTGKSMFDAPRGDKYRIVVEDDVWIGWGAIILSGVTIGRRSIVAAALSSPKMCHVTALSRRQPRELQENVFLPMKSDFMKQNCGERASFAVLPPSR
jgi:carbonic anhydrase/acetyltransferase-like protein (isoleucine patch superfamily)